ncbi:uncharacterized protein LOC134219894 isoform X1 [Armigeres subalbatus]|uniref:uncharacterized protein LOC134219894 isoform X1 n=1 Tax=Armigeres subalbatus TaxID=124917 RepID=UPI002ED19F18
MPPKRTKELPTKRENRSRGSQKHDINKMTAYELNSSDLRYLLRTALEREGDRFDPSGYAYVTVGEGSNPAALESQDPLASEHPPFDDRKSAEKEKQAAHGAGTSGLRGSQKGKDFLQSSLRNHDEWIENTYATGESIPKKEGGTCTFLDDLSQHISIPIEDESVPCKRLKSKKEIIQEVPITPNQDPLKLVAQPLGVDELRAMLQAALQHQEEVSKSAERHTPPFPIEAGHTRSLEIVHQMDKENSSVIERETADASASKPNPVIDEFGEPNAVIFNIEEEHLEDDDSQNIADDHAEHSGQINTPLGSPADRSPLSVRKISSAGAATNVLNKSPNIDYPFAASVEDDNSWKVKYKKLEGNYKELSDKHKKCKQKIAKLEQDKLTSDDYALRIGKELMFIKDKQKIPQAQFTEENGIPITVNELDEINNRADTDSFFVALLVTRLVGSEKLIKMSATGQASHRFSKLKNMDGTPMYPAQERIDPKLVEFICSK